MRHLPIALLALSSSALAQHASAVWPSSQGGNDHTYAVFTPGATLDWTAASAAATAAGGHLCTITSAAENAFVFSLIDDPVVWVTSFGTYNLGPWIGGVQAAGSVEPAGGWGWATGEALTYSNWVPGQPNDVCAPREDHQHFCTNSPTARGPQWNDLSPGSCNLPIAYVVEFETPACFFGTVGLASGGPADVFTINASAGGWQRRVENAIGDSFPLAMAPPPGTSSAPFLLGAFAGAAGSGPTLPLPFGEFCFAAPFQIGTVLHAPWTQVVPAGLALVGPFTLQGLMVTDLTAPTFATTNAVILDFVPSQPPTITEVSPLSAPAGVPVTVTGEHFNNSATVTINGASVPLTSANASSITFANPPGIPCDAVLQVTNINGQNATATINPTPTVTSTILASGPAAGGAPFVLIGNGFAPGTVVQIGGASMTINASSWTSISGTTPPGVPGPATVVIITPTGCVTTTTYTYQ